MGKLIFAFLVTFWIGFACGNYDDGESLISVVAVIITASTIIYFALKGFGFY